ncbi:MAG: hypothetical protein RR497_05970 [Oscillospiraceae bacterium]
MICSNCNHEYEGDSCPFCDNISLKNDTTQTNKSGVRICPRCNNTVSQRYCSICGFDLEFVNLNNNVKINPCYNPNFDNSTSSEKTKRVSTAQQTWRIILIALASVSFAAAFIIITANISKSFPFSGNNNSTSSSTQTNNSAYNFPAGVSLSEFDKLQLGMSYAHVSSIIGGDAVNVATQERPQGGVVTIYTWYGENNKKAVVYVSFIDDKVSELNQEGL